MADTSMPVKPVLILGIGNILLRDEGVGVRVVEAMRDADIPSCAETLDGGTSGADLIDFVAGRRKLIVIDAVHVEARPGTVVRFGVDALVRRAGALSLHELGILDVLSMAEHLGCAPAEVVFFGVAPRDLSPGLEMSDPVGRAVPAVIEAVLKEARGEKTRKKIETQRSQRAQRMSGERSFMSRSGKWVKGLAGHAGPLESEP